MTRARAAAYLRKSKDASTKADHLSALMASVRADGQEDAVVYDDWARSGDIRKLAKRIGWRDMCAAIERGEHDVVFMNDLDRGGRSIEEWARFMRVARDRGVRVVAGGVDWAAPERKLEFYLRAVFAEEELERAKSRSATTTRIREGRGDETTASQPPYGYRLARAADVGQVTADCADPRRVVLVPNPDEPLAPVLDAIAETGGNVLAAAKLLTERGVPTRGGRPWSARALGRIADREGALRTRRGTGARSRRRAPSDAPLSRLVECHCGTLMTPGRDRRTGRWVELYCHVGHRLGTAAHGRVTARARHVLDLLRSETARLSTIHIERSTTSEDAAERRARVEARRARFAMMFGEGEVDEATWRREQERARRDLAEVEDVEDAWAGFSPRRPLVDWDGPDADLGERLRKIVRVVRLGPDMLPTEVEWRLPSLARRAERGAAA
ncbi:MAG: recombinase family protein [Chloroflexota bacterium]